MNKKQQFINFLESFKGNGQDVLIESVKQGFITCFEAEEAVNPEVFAKSIEDIIKKYFPNSYVNVKHDNGFKDSIYGAFMLGKDKTEWANGISENDPLKHTFHIWFEPDGTYQLEWSQGNMTIKSENPMFAFSRIKTGMRTKRGTAQDIIRTLDNFFKKLPIIVSENKEKIHPSDIELFKSKGLI
jgi:hypothetical protein